MQRLRGRGWVNAIELPDTRVTLRHLLEKGWVESREEGKHVAYRITEHGMAAKTAPIPVYGRKKRRNRDGEAVQRD